MYKKIIFTKLASENMEQMNARARTAIKEFLENNGWSVQTDLSNGINFCLTKSFKNQDASPSQDANKKVFDFYSQNIFYNGSSWEPIDPNGTFHLSVSRPPHNSRVLSVVSGENPATYHCYDTTYKRYNDYKQTGYEYADTKITALCSQDPDGYQDSGERFGFAGHRKNIAHCSDGNFGISGWKNEWSNLTHSSSDYSINSKTFSEVRLDDSLTELVLELFYFVDDDLQEEFYAVFRTNQMFGRKAPENNNFYQTLMFVKMPGYPMLCSSTLYESPNFLVRGNNTEITSKVYEDPETGVKEFCNFGRNCGYYFELSYYGDWQVPNMSTVTKVSKDFNPRWDAPDSTPDLWLHHAVTFWNPTFYSHHSDSYKDSISCSTSGSGCRHHTMKIFGLANTFFSQPYFKETVDEKEHTIYSTIGANDLFGSYEFLYDQSCSSETGTSLLVPIQRQHQYKMHRNGPRHCKWYNMFYTTPEKVVTPEKDDVSLTWKCYPSKRRSIQGYVNYLNKSFNSTYWVNPVNKKSYANGDNGYYRDTTTMPAGPLYWFTEDMTSSTTGQPILTDCCIGAELDASGFEGFALDYSEYSAEKVETVNL